MATTRNLAIKKRKAQMMAMINSPLAQNGRGMFTTQSMIGRGLSPRDAADYERYREARKAVKEFKTSF